MKLMVCENIEEFSTVAAHLIYENIHHRKATICLPTGSTPIPVYEKLVEIMQDATVFSEVKFFNLDEYAGLEPVILRVTLIFSISICTIIFRSEKISCFFSMAAMIPKLSASAMTH
jgi:hypothetical protein